MRDHSTVIDVKLEYCRKCGGCLDKNRRCTSCGKQYLHVNKTFLLKCYAICLTLILAAVIWQNNWNVQNTYAWIELYNEADAEKLELTQKLEDSEDMRRGLKGQNDRLSKDYVDLLVAKSAVESEVKFYEKRFVCVTETGSKYHRHACYHIANRSGWVISLNEAKSKGYTACADCWG